MGKHKSLRKKKSSILNESDGEEEEDGLNLAPASLIAARKQKQKNVGAQASVKGKEAIAGKKKIGSKLNLKIAASAHAPPVEAGRLSRTSFGEYTAERLQELAKLTSKKPESGLHESEEIKISGSFVKGNGSAPVASIEGGFMDVVKEPVSSPVEDGIVGIDIPDEEFIRAAREKRERARYGGMNADYVPLENGARFSSLMTKDDGKESKGNGIDYSRFGATKAGSEVEDDDITGEDAEFEHWAQEQIRKGMSSGLLREEKMTMPAVRKAQPSVSTPSFGQQFDAAAISESVIGKIEARLQRTQLSYTQHEKSLMQTAENLKSTQESIAEDERSILQLNTEFYHAQKMKHYISSLCVMLGVKSPIIDELEEKLIKSRSKKASAWRERSTLNCEEEMMQGNSAIEAATDAFDQGCTLMEAAARAKARIEWTEEHLLDGEHISPTLDEYWEDQNTAKRIKVQAEVKRKLKIIHSLEEKFERNGDDWKEPNLGDIVSSESEDEVEQYRSRQQEIIDECSSIFNDVDDEYSNIEVIKTRLENWKKTCPNQYQATYMALSAPALFAPFARLEFTRWDPLDPTSGAFSEHNWYRTLFSYGSDAPESDPDHQLIPKLISDVVLPYLIDHVRDVWNPYCPAQCRAVSSFMEDLLIYMDPTGSKASGCLNVVTDRLVDAENACPGPSWPPSAIEASPRAQVMANKNFGRTLRLVRGICYFINILPDCVDDLVFSSLLPCLALKHVLAAMTDANIFCDRSERLLKAIPAPVAQLDRKPINEFYDEYITALETVAGRVEAQAGTHNKKTIAAAQQLCGLLMKLFPRKQHLLEQYQRLRCSYHLDV
eukprot:jgi/Picsp_1/6432/NSC_03780-R1_gc-rich sequence dna-binding factor 1-like